MANTLSELLLAQGNATFEELSDTLRALEGKISHLKLSIVQSLNSTFVLYEADLERVIQWHTEIVLIQKELMQLEEQLSKGKNVLSSAHQDLQSITYDLSQCMETIQLLKSLVDVVKNFERADPANYYNASKLIKVSEIELKCIASEFPSAEDHIWIKQLRARFSDLSVDVHDKCRREWGDVFQFDKNSLIVFAHIANIEHLVESFKNIKSFTRIWDKFVNIFWQELVKPACYREYKIEVVSAVKSEVSVKQERGQDASTLPISDFLESSLIDSENGGDPLMQGGIIIRARKQKTPFSSAKDLFQNIMEIVKAMNLLFRGCDEELMNLSETLAQKINAELCEKYLKDLILENCKGNIDVARDDVAQMGKCVADLSYKYNFNFPEQSAFECIEQNFDKIFESYVRQALIVKIRELIKADVHNTKEINNDCKPNAELSVDEIALLRKNPAMFPKIVVSEPISDVVDLLKEHMKKYPNDISMSSSVFSLYLALVAIPKHEADVGEMVPVTSVLIHNNSLFLAHHAGFTFDDVDEVVPELRAKARQAIAFMMRCIRSKLNELISTAMSSIEERVDRKIDITHDFLVITAELKRLDTVMNGMLSTATWHDILATLVDHTVNELCSKVLAWDDIPANSASELAHSFGQFAVSTSSLFKADASTPREVEALTTRAVKKWQRFKLLIFVLTASMVEIETKWVGGCGPLAIEFTPEEVRRLVRALFQNTDRRAAFLATIK